MIRKYSKLVVLCAAVLSTAAFAGCGSRDSDKKDTKSKPKAEQKVAVRKVVTPQGTLAPAAAAVGDPTRRSAGITAAGAGVLPRFFAGNSPWNVPVVGADVDPNSEQLLSLGSQRLVAADNDASGRVNLTLRPVDNSVFINTIAWTTAIVTTDKGRDTKVFCRQVDCGRDARGLTRLKIPADVDPDPRYDGWVTVLDVERNTAYDLWRARRQRDSSISFQFVRRWDINGPGFGAPKSFSARGSGLPLFAGGLTLQELKAGRIDHALAIALPGAAKRRYVAPASGTDGVGDPDAIPEGAHIRLRESVVMGRAPRGANARVGEAIKRALQTYGAIVVGRARVPTLFAQKDVTAELVRGNELQSLKLSDFEVLRLGRVFNTSTTTGL